MWKKVLLLCCTITASMAEKKKVCVIGAGASGLTSVKQLAELLEEFQPVVFEKNSDIGGLWKYTEHTDLDEHNLPVHSSMYKSLRVNFPKEFMVFPDYQNFSGDQSYPPHEAVQEYLKNFTDHFNLRQYIQFDTVVEKVVPVLGNGDWRTTKWHLSARNLNSNTTFKETCDVVMVCNGHLFKQYIPKIPGMETFPGKVINSHNYRRPDGFAGKTVAVLGAALSGQDIASEISQVAKKVYLLHNMKNPRALFEGLPERIHQVPGLASANGSTLTLKDNSTIEADTFVYCTGYVYDFPFLDTSSGISVDDNYVSPIYRQLVNVEHPSMALVGLPNAVVHFPLVYTQAKYYIALLRGKAHLPLKKDMLKDSELPPGTRKRRAHAMPMTQWLYNRELAEAGGFEPLPAFYERGYDLWFEHYNADPTSYRDSNFKVYRNGSVEIVYPDDTGRRAEA